MKTKVTQSHQSKRVLPMKTNALFAATICAAFLAIVCVPRDAGAFWIGTNGDELIELDRVDNGTHAPLHEKTVGHYGFWRSSSEWVDVLDFSLTNPLIYPWTWSTVTWEPDPLRDWPGGYTFLPPSQLPVRDLLAQALEGRSPASRHSIAPMFGSQLPDLLAFGHSEAIVVRRDDIGVPAA